MIQEFLGQTNFAGRDGFYWWIGQIETQKGEQSKSDDRYKVRIVGQHLRDCNAVDYNDLPWAIVMMPATAPRREGGTNFQSVQYKSGDWVLGFFLDGKDGQQPVILGSIGQQYKASETHTGKQKPAEKCLGFTTFLDPDVNLNAAAPASQKDAVQSGGVDGTKGGTTTPAAGAKPDLNQPPNTSNESASTLLLGTKCCNSETNPAGEYFCTEISDAKCESADNDKSKFELVLTELFGNITNNGGQFGTQIVGKYTGKLYDYVDIAQGYVNKTVRLANSIVARVKGEMFAYIKQGAKAVIDFLLTEEVVDPTQPGTFVGPYADPDKAVKPAKKRVGRLRGLTAWINDQLKNVNCVMEDLDARLRSFIEDLIFKALEQVINAARCFIDELVNDIFNQIAKFLEDAITAILGPLQQLLTIIANPLNILGAAIQQIFDILGISCGGADSKCSSQEQLKNCTGPCGKQDEYGLDDLLAAIENGNLDTGTGSCSESLNYPPVSPTTAIVIGGTPNPSSYTGTTPVTLPPDSTDPTTDPNVFNNTTDPTTTTGGDPADGFITPATVSPTTSTPVTLPVSSGFTDFASQPNTTEVSGDLPLTVVAGTSPSVFTNGLTQVFIAEFSNELLKIDIQGEATTEFTSAAEDTTQSLTYALSVDKTLVFEGDSLTFTLVANGAVVEDGTIFNYAMFGDITPEDFFDKKTVGTMTMFGNVATKTITIADDALEEDLETVTFNVKEASRSVPFTIAASDKPSKPATPDSDTQPAFVPPVLGTPEVCGDGRVMDIPIVTRGDAYLTPPMVVIRGAGFGASASAELDENGYLKRIRVQRSGTGYAPNRVKQNCVVANFLMINPGSGYYSDPMVYVDGASGVAKANIDSRGYVSNIEVIDKTKTFACTPRVEIFGGNGLGARAIPVMECRDDATFTAFKTEIAPSGVDSVIDCP